MIEEFGIDQLGQIMLQRRLIHRRHGPDILEGKLAAQGGGQLGGGFDSAQAVETSHEGIVQGDGNIQHVEWSGQFVVIIALLDQPQFQNHARHFFHKEGHAVRARHELIPKFLRQGFAAGNLHQHVISLGWREAVERDVTEMRAPTP